MPSTSGENLSLLGSFEDLSLSVQPGEIVGISGLLGSGRTEFARALFGMETVSAGTISIDGKTVTPATVKQAIDEGIAYVPEDRLSEGLFLTQSIKRNVLASSLEALQKWFVIDQSKASSWAKQTVKE